MGGFRDIFIDSTRRVRRARAMYAKRLGRPREAEVEAARLNAAAGPGERQRFAWADRVFTVGVKRVSRFRDGKVVEVEEPQTMEQTVRANKEYFNQQEKYSAKLDDAARDEYLMALRADRELNDSAVGIFQANGGHRRNKFTRRLYRAWLAAQPRERGTMEDPLWEQHARRRERMEAEAEVDDRAAVFGGRVARRKRGLK